MKEAEYLRDYELIRADVHGAIRFFFTSIEIHKAAGEDQDIYRAINKNAAFWNAQLYSLQTTFFIVLARIFDNGGDAHSIHKLLAAAVKHPAFFSKQALAARKKETAREETPEWLEGFLEGAWEPTVSELRELKNSLKPSTAKFQAVYAPIRSKVFAHRVVKETALVSELFERTLIADIDGILHGLFYLLETIWQVLYNGRRPAADQRGQYERLKGEIAAETRAVLEKLAEATPV